MLLAVLSLSNKCADSTSRQGQPSTLKILRLVSPKMLLVSLKATNKLDQTKKYVETFIKNKIILLFHT